MITYKATWTATNNSGYNREIIVGIEFNDPATPFTERAWFRIFSEFCPPGFHWTINYTEGINLSTGSYKMYATAFDRYTADALKNKQGDLKKTDGTKIGEYYAWLTSNDVYDELNTKSTFLNVTKAAVTIDSFSAVQQ